jgi:uncharacterized membrane protein YfcA
VGPIGAATATFVAFVAASLVWLRGHLMLDLAGIRMLVAVGAVTLGGFVVLLLPGTRFSIGIGTISIALIFAYRGWLRMPQASRHLGSLLR